MISIAIDTHNKSTMIEVAFTLRTSSGCDCIPKVLVVDDGKENHFDARSIRPGHNVST